VIERLRELFRYDAETGFLYWLNLQASNIKPGDPAGHEHVNGLTRYLCAGINGVLYLNHVLIFAMHYGRWPDLDLDHSPDHDGLNNRIENLREATKAENAANRRGARCGSTSNFKGVHWNTARNKWAAGICFNGLIIRLALFPLADERLAALTYDAAAKLAFGSFACLNFPAEDSAHIVLPKRGIAKIEPAKLEGRP
jgi:hypothetical protein